MLKRSVDSAHDPRPVDDRDAAKDVTTPASVAASLTRRSVVAGLTVTATPVGVFAVDDAYAQIKQAAAEKSLYERLGGVFALAAVVDHFSDAVVKNPIVGQKSKNPQLRDWHTKNLGRLPGLKFMRTLWVCNVSGGPFQFTATRPGKTPLGLEEAHRDLRISPAEFDEVAAELGRSLDSPRCQSARRRKCWQPLPRTKTTSPPATSRPTSAPEGTQS
jgi:hemoglobin